MAHADLKWVATAIMSGFLRRQAAHPDRIPQWVDAVTDVLTAADARPANDQQLHHIFTLLQELKSMSQTTQGAVDHVAAAVASMKSEVQADVAAVAAQVADLKQQIADLKAAGSGATPDQITSLEASASDLDATVKTLHDGLNPAPPASGGVVFDSNDQTPNSPGGRNSSQLPGFDSSMPETA